MKSLVETQPTQISIHQIQQKHIRQWQNGGMFAVGRLQTQIEIQIQIQIEYSTYVC